MAASKPFSRLRATQRAGARATPCILFAILVWSVSVILISFEFIVPITQPDVHRDDQHSGARSQRAKVPPPLAQPHPPVVEILTSYLASLKTQARQTTHERAMAALLDPEELHPSPRIPPLSPYPIPSTTYLRRILALRATDPLPQGLPRVAIVLLVAGTAADILPWIAYHVFVGVDHFYLFYDGADRSTLEVLRSLRSLATVVVSSDPDLGTAIRLCRESQSVRNLLVHKNAHSFKAFNAHLFKN